MSNLPQKYVDVARALIPYIDDRAESHQMVLIKIDPTLPCFLCGKPAPLALVAPAPQYAHNHTVPWLTFPICQKCETAQVQSQSGESD
ncbi:MAG: hypothetical protein KDJ65_19090 [Anaerolineae bacterium]|nr:hypothetical protein [Anaerolineae bacterium]